MIRDTLSAAAALAHGLILCLAAVGAVAWLVHTLAPPLD